MSRPIMECWVADVAQAGGMLLALKILFLAKRTVVIIRDSGEIARCG